jgi:hypothetical protein
MLALFLVKKDKRQLPEDKRVEDYLRKIPAGSDRYEAILNGLPDGFGGGIEDNLTQRAQGPAAGPPSHAPGAVRTSTASGRGGGQSGQGGARSGGNADSQAVRLYVLCCVSGISQGRVRVCVCVCVCLFFLCYGVWVSVCACMHVCVCVSPHARTY